MEKQPVIEITAVGTELLTPHFQDTNSLVLTQRLNGLGLEVAYKTITGDKWDLLTASMRDSIARSDILILMGGLGPTKDDLTREALASVIGRKLVFKKELYKAIQGRFSRRGIDMPPINKKQAYVFEKSSVLENKNGTASGLWLESQGKIIILLPGPPHEIIPMFDESVLPRLEKFRKNHIACQVLRVAGLSESRIEALLSGFYPLEKHINLTTLAKPGQIELRISARSTKDQESAQKSVSEVVEKIKAVLGDLIFTFQGEDLEKVIGQELHRRRATLAAAESCTGGFLGHRITNIPGSSEYFLEGVIVYSNKAKTRLLGIDPDLILRHGAVSHEVAKAMAEGIRKKASSDYGLAITGIAGPGGGSPEKPVGLVYTALSLEGNTHVERNQFLGDRSRIKFQASQKSLDMLWRQLFQSG